MILVLQIALGIVLAIVILAYWKNILKLTVLIGIILIVGLILLYLNETNFIEKNISSLIFISGFLLILLIFNIISNKIYSAYKIKISILDMLGLVISLSLIIAITTFLFRQEFNIDTASPYLIYLILLISFFMYRIKVIKTIKNEIE